MEQREREMTSHNQTAHGSRPRVLVLMGGPDAEREVSLMSGTQVAEALVANGAFEVIALVVDRPSASDLLAHAPDVIYPVLHGPWGEGGPLQEILEEIEVSCGVPYVGPGSRAAAIAMDKVRTKMVATRIGIRTPLSREVRTGEPINLPLPFVLKPSNDGSSFDLRICRTDDDVSRARAEIEPRRSALMVEQYIAGREMTVGVVDGVALPVIEILPATAFYDFEAKYYRDDTRYVLDPEVPAGVLRDMRDAAEAIYREIGLRDAARADFMVDERGAWFLEINSAPGMTTHSLVPKAARHRGIDMPELCGGFVRRALGRREALRAARALAEQT